MAAPLASLGEKGKIGEPYFSRTLRVHHDDRTRRILDAKLRQFGVRRPRRVLCPRRRSGSSPPGHTHLC